MTEKKNITIKIENEDQVAPLYMQFPGQCNPQPAYIEIDPRGDNIEVFAEINYNIGPGCSQAVFNDEVQQISVTYSILGSALKEFLESEEFQTDVLDMCEGYENKWDGSNHSGYWNHRVYDIKNKIEQDLWSVERASIYEGDEWISDAITYYDAEGEKTLNQSEAHKAVYDESGLNIEVTIENIEKIVSDSESWIENNQVVDDIEGALERIIEEIKFNCE
jgi:hypothetical protein